VPPPERRLTEVGEPIRPLHPIGTSFVKARGMQLTLDGSPFYFSGTNWFRAIQNDSWTYTDQVGVLGL
jgi:hypothetical protein